MKERRGAWNASSQSGDLYREMGETVLGKGSSRGGRLQPTVPTEGS